MPEKRTLFKVGCGAVAASAIVAGVVFEVVQHDELTAFGENGKMSTQDYEFMSYVSTYGKQYATTQEYKMRASNWARSDVAIKRHNADPKATSKTGHNYLSDMSPQELSSMKGFNASQQANYSGSSNWFGPDGPMPGPPGPGGPGGPGGGPDDPNGGGGEHIHIDPYDPYTPDDPSNNGGGGDDPDCDPYTQYCPSSGGGGNDPECNPEYQDCPSNNGGGG